MKRLVQILAASLAVAACGSPSEPAARESEATVRLPAVPGRPGAAYFSVTVEGDRGALVSVASPQAGRIEMHETMAHGRMTSMRPLARIPVGDGETLSFEPGGRHLMLYDLRADLRPGARVQLILNFERGAPRTVEAVAEPAGGAAH